MNEDRKKITVMAHLVAGYPTTDLAREAAHGLAEGGVSYFEIQFPFSDPSADGKAIQSACAEVLSRKYRVNEAFEFVAELHRSYPDIPVFIMTYGNLAYKSGIESFVASAARAGASGLIIPDLPYDADEGLESACRKHSLVSVPVAAPSMTSARLSSLAKLNRPFVYAALRSGITGASTEIDEKTLSFIRSVTSRSPESESSSVPGESSGTKVLGGFGIKNGTQSRSLSPEVHAVVAGSVFVDLIRENAPKGAESVREAVRRKAEELCGI